MCVCVCVCVCACVPVCRCGVRAHALSANSLPQAFTGTPQSGVVNRTTITNDGGDFISVTSGENKTWRCSSPSPFPRTVKRSVGG